MKQIYINTLKLHDVNDATIHYLIKTPIQGLEFSDIRMINYANAGQDGINIANAYQGERRVTLEGKVYADSQSDLETYRNAIPEALRPTKDANGLLEDKTLRFTDMAGNEYRLLCQTMNLKMPREGLNASDFFIDLLGAYPYIEDYTQTTATVTLYRGGGFVLPVVLPASFDAGTGGSEIINNAGDAPAYPVITIYGPITNPRIQNVTLNKTVGLTLSVANGSYVTIDMYNKTITQGGVTNRLSNITSDSQWWWLASNNNTIILTSSTSGEAGYASVAYRSAYTGI